VLVDRQCRVSLLRVNCCVCVCVCVCGFLVCKDGKTERTGRGGHVEEWVHCRRHSNDRAVCAGVYCQDINECGDSHTCDLDVPEVRV
jgi:hypothetical protein